MTGSGPVTSYDVASHAGVSQATVSMVLNGTSGRIRVSDATRQRVLDAAQELGYVPNHAARSLSSRRSNTLTVITYGLDNPYYVGVVRGAQVTARAHGYAVNVVSVEGADEESTVLRHLAGGSSDGIIDAGGYNPDTIPALLGLAARGIPVVATAWHRSPDPSIPTIRVNFERGGWLATRHLVELGHRRIAHVTDASGDDQYTRADSPVGARVKGYRRALNQSGIDPAPELLLPGRNSPAGGAEATLALLELPERRRPTAIFFFNDYMATGGLHALWKAGVRVPEDVAVVGFDGTPAGLLTTPELTTVEVHHADLGARAVDYVLRMLDGRDVPSTRPMPLRLVVRDSCGGHLHRRHREATAR